MEKTEIEQLERELHDQQNQQRERVRHAVNPVTRE